MSVSADDVAWVEALAVYERLRGARDQRSRMLLEAVLEDLYAQTHERGDESVVELIVLLGAAETPPVAAAWRALLALNRTYDASTLEALDQALARTPPRSAWLISVERARLMYRIEGPMAAWGRIATVQPVIAAEPWLDDGPLVIHAFVVALRLAAASGHWQEHDRIAELACARFGHENDARVLRIRLACADHDVMRGRYERAVRTLDRMRRDCRGDLRFALHIVRLHALVACASQRRDTRLREAIEHAMAEIAGLREIFEQATAWATGDDAYRLPADERAELVHRFEQLAKHANLGADVIEPEEVASLADALAVERRARRDLASRPSMVILGRLLPPVEALLSDPKASEHREAWFRLRLLWCRLVVDLEAVDRYDTCEHELTDMIVETTHLGLLPLTMSAYDQRAVLYTQEAMGAWDEAVADAGKAGEIAVRLLSENGSLGGDGDRIMERALLGTLLPVFDRVIDLLIQGALTWETDGGRSRTSWHPERHERWLRFGRAIHDYVEQSQALALKEARRAYGMGDAPIPHRFVLAAPGQEPESPLPELRAAMRSWDAVAQYFVTGRFVVVFCYARRYFDWVLVDAVSEVQREGASLDDATAHAALSYLIRESDAWLKGENTPEEIARAAPLGRLLMPDAITGELARARNEHVRIVPHDVLYRVPFGRLELRGRPLVEQVSLSVHPTAGLAAESAMHGSRPDRCKSIGYVFEPSLGSVERERAAVRASLGRILSLGALVPIDTSHSQSTAEVIDWMKEVDVLHMACHGNRPVGRREASLQLGTGRWKLSELASLHMRRCALAILQSCWTGWMEHERTNPVQGFPQAFCDAGVGAVIAPLVKVPDSLTPVFADVFYRALRFLPAERALRATLDTLREHGAALLADDPEAHRDWLEFGPHDTLEYRYIGHTGLSLGGGLMSRLVGRLSFWYWLRRARRRAHPNADPIESE